jgi:hypothetical protein
MGWERSCVFEFISPIFEMSPVVNFDLVGLKFLEGFKKLQKQEKYFEAIFWVCHIFQTSETSFTHFRERSKFQKMEI